MKLKFPGEEGIWPQGRKLSSCLSYLCVQPTQLPCGLWTRTLPPTPHLTSQFLKISVFLCISY